MLSELYFALSIISLTLTETKIKDYLAVLMNIDLPGYRILSFPNLPFLMLVE